jgi:oligopeptide/dipeptide ABC transporter ATP-binding protein
VPTDTSLSTAERPAATGAPSVVVDGLDLDYVDTRTIRALSGINLTVQEGEVMALVGETGSGKSSLVHSILNLLPGTSRTGGDIRLRLQGQDVQPLRMNKEQAREFRRKHVAFIPQLTKRALVPVLTVGEHFRQYLGGGGPDPERRVESLLRSVGLTDPGRVLASYPHQLSGGMAQRVCIALAMCGSSSLIVADEPTSGLDALVKIRVADLLKATVEEPGRTMLLVTHDLLLVERIATKVAVLYGGALVETGSVEQVFGSPAHPYTAALVGATPQPGKPLSVLPGAVQRSSEAPTACAFAARCPVKHERCVSEVPPLRELADGRKVATWCTTS